METVFHGDGEKLKDHLIDESKVLERIERQGGGDDWWGAMNYLRENPKVLLEMIPSSEEVKGKGDIKEEAEEKKWNRL